ncbi:uncharacterized protein BDR25DRAFT_372742 [Lindgomyces ingoldianus]|uniref:Uncharacterized protein n=1 Tax=Lindgomyces ingoldianus TaxID=673940 RepID=A0ACB6QPE0_9PLEO|nr:uncharacterized protein BDR25DRAFT_372742 [Lindgomyces ingoldianus]KAF2468884.1 hypothetical protein BDR25DRAFT_372742 [Lindgomyces ingoldianus]
MTPSYAEDTPPRTHPERTGMEPLQRNTHIEVDIRYSPLRFGYPKLPSLPVQTTVVNASNYIRERIELFQHCAEILERGQIEVVDRFLAIRHHEGEREPDKFITLVFLTKLPSIDTDVSSRCVLDIANYCNTKGVHYLIELITNAALYGGFTFAIHPSERDLITLWEDISTTIVDRLSYFQDQKKCTWQTLDFLRRGGSECREDCPATMVIGSPDADEDFWWTIGLAELRSLTHGRFCIELLYSKAYEVMDDHMVTTTAYEDPVLPGASISSGLGSGTLGGQIKIETQAGVRAFALTNHHVVVGKDLEQSKLPIYCLHMHTLSLNLVNGEHNPIYPNNQLLLSNPTVISSPADEDHRLWISTITKEKKFWKDRIDGPKGLKEKFDLLQAGEKPTWLQEDSNSLLNKLNAAEEALKTLHSDMDTVYDCNRVLGQLAAASGRRTRDGHENPQPPRPVERRGRVLPWLMDWAVITLDSGRTVQNTLGGPHLKEGKTRLTVGQDANAYEVLDRNEAHLVAYRGRTSGWIFGELNGTYSILNKFTTCKVAEEYDLSGSSPAYSWAIVNKDKKSDLTAKAGDSGSVVFLDRSYGVNEDARWVGLVFGQSPSKVGYMIPIHHLFKDIEEVFGGTIIEPQRTTTT